MKTKTVQMPVFTAPAGSQHERKDPLVTDAGWCAGLFIL
jgi:hypothetical protein